MNSTQISGFKYNFNDLISDSEAHSPEFKPKNGDSDPLIKDSISKTTNTNSNKSNTSTQAVDINTHIENTVPLLNTLNTDLPNPKALPKIINTCSFISGSYKNVERFQSSNLEDKSIFEEIKNIPLDSQQTLADSACENFSSTDSSYSISPKSHSPDLNFFGPGIPLQNIYSLLLSESQNSEKTNLPTRPRRSGRSASNPIFDLPPIPIRNSRLRKRYLSDSESPGPDPLYFYNSRLPPLAKKSKRFSNTLSLPPNYSDFKEDNLNTPDSAKFSDRSCASMVIVLKQPPSVSPKNSPVDTSEISEAELLRKRMFFFLSVPFEIEKLMVLGIAICTNAFLNAFIDLPMSALSFIFSQLHYFYLFTFFHRKQHSFPSMSKPNYLNNLASLYKILVFLLTFYIVGKLDSAKTYHLIRAQSSLKLYFIYNSLELFDKLLTSFGLDTLDSTQYSILKLINYKKSTFFELFLSLLHFVIGLIYMIMHTLVLYLQVLSLNVAINSYSQQLLLLLISNQFVELKGNILKKFEKETFFQLACGDIVERFEQFVFLGLIITQNFFELFDSASFGTSELFPRYFYQLFSFESLQLDFLLNRVLIPVLLVIGTEILVDWVKHAFISKFNWFRPYLYTKYGDILCRDLVGATPADDRLNADNVSTTTVLFSSPRSEPLPDLAPKVARRMGFWKTAVYSQPGHPSC
ncbi:Endoplasmic reticulum membrane protein 65 [Smittium mucronatum]|uniref:Endoplasmic reticulum membrane protein 65 n=1 Tax=Smittium mucronatum TaxID=133383 RepID=A0A1R0GND0_9FUNG|nr:Endoplasmic reticulum membrane protein 65 [Smittium mucronatum]